jgi:hypothetical protein
MFSVLRNRHPLTVLLLIPIAACLVGIHYFFSKEIVLFNFSVFQKQFFFQRLEASLLYGLLLCINSLLLNSFFNRQNLLDFYSHIGGLFYLILSFTSIQLFEVSVLIADFFVIVSLIFIAQLRNNEDARVTIFNVTLFLTLAVIFNLNYAPLLLLPFIGLASFRGFVFREYLIIFLANSFVVVYVWFYYFYFELAVNDLFLLSHKFQWTPYVAILFGINVLLLILSFATRRIQNGSPGIRIEKLLRLWFIVIFVQLSAFLIAILLKFDIMVYSSVYLSLYLTYAYNISRYKWFFHFLTYSLIIATFLEHLQLL